MFERSLPPENKGDGDRHMCGAAGLFVELNDVTDSEQTLQRVPPGRGAGAAVTAGLSHVVSTV